MDLIKFQEQLRSAFKNEKKDVFSYETIGAYSKKHVQWKGRQKKKYVCEWANGFICLFYHFDFFHNYNFSNIVA